MNTTIIVLLILLIVNQLMALVGNSKVIGKNDCINYYKGKLDQANRATISDSASMFAFLIILAIRVSIVFFAIKCILSFVN